MIYDIDLFMSYLQNKEEEWQPEPLYLYDYEEEYANEVQEEKEQKRVIIIDI
tara:strand:+ start:189 stop:344 length:156 start_codon:yes stop_codon:yes gene_type:complete